MIVFTYIVIRKLLFFTTQYYYSVILVTVVDISCIFMFNNITYLLLLKMCTIVLYIIRRYRHYNLIMKFRNLDFEYR